MSKSIQRNEEKKRAESPKICPKCGRKLLLNYKICHQCGESLSNQDASEQAV